MQDEGRIKAYSTIELSIVNIPSMNYAKTGSFNCICKKHDNVYVTTRNKYTV